VYNLSGVHEAVMRSQFEYEVPSLLKKAALTLKAPHRWRSRVRPWVFDKKSGVRFQLDAAEHAALKPLTSRMRNGSTSLPVAVAFNEAAAAIMDRRRGYCFEWNRLAKRARRVGELAGRRVASAAVVKLQLTYPVCFPEPLRFRPFLPK
jgi:hypothetical protein